MAKAARPPDKGAGSGRAAPHTVFRAPLSAHRGPGPAEMRRFTHRPPRVDRGGSAAIAGPGRSNTAAPTPTRAYSHAHTGTPAGTITLCAPEGAHAPYPRRPAHAHATALPVTAAPRPCRHLQHRLSAAPARVQAPTSPAQKLSAPARAPVETQGVHTPVSPLPATGHCASRAQPHNCCLVQYPEVDTDPGPGPCPPCPLPAPPGVGGAPAAPTSH